MKGVAVQKSIKISVVTPSLNQGDFVKECIESVLAQNYPDFEHIIVDGYSTDHTAQVVAQYPHVRFIQMKSTAAQAYSYGLQEAVGDYVCFLNTDDFYTPESFKKLSQAVKENPSTHIFTGAYSIHKGDVVLVHDTRPADFMSFETIAFYPPGLNALFFEREFIQSIGPFNPACKLANDRDFLLRCSLRRPVIGNLHHPLLVYRFHENSSTINNDVFYNELILKEHFEIINSFLSKDLTTEQRHVLLAWQAFEDVHYLLILLHKSGARGFLRAFATFLLSQQSIRFLRHTLPIYLKKKYRERTKGSR
jgi:glycosyltransferase involved in cell wall biosynthesis